MSRLQREIIAYLKALRWGHGRKVLIKTNIMKNWKYLKYWKLKGILTLLGYIFLIIVLMLGFVTMIYAFIAGLWGYKLIDVAWFNTKLFLTSGVVTFLFYVITSIIIRDEK